MREFTFVFVCGLLAVTLAAPPAAKKEEPAAKKSTAPVAAPAKTVKAPVKPATKVQELKQEKFEPVKSSGPTKEEEYRKFLEETEHKLPFKTNLKKGVQEGQTVFIIGKLCNDTKRVDVNFRKGKEILMHLSLRFDEGIFSGKLVYNTFENGNWSEDEQRGKHPFKSNGTLDLRIRVLNGRVQVFGDKSAAANFELKKPLDAADSVEIDGDIESLRVFRVGGKIYEIPYSESLKFGPGKRIDITALPTGNRVDVNLHKKNKDFAFQLSMRLGEGVIVRNAMENGQWGKEEREGGIPVRKGKIFDLMIANEKFGYQVFIDGKRFAAFSHRGDPSDIESVDVEGDAELYGLEISDSKGV
ncbi:hypothetical protein AB6A40_002839 [Gnathostoma spinigerum]|uniref:Galectin n=1 Tax=Gnathostoma spinigerum TaxID=75299 RepID=A0ABD6E7R1_9BILA